MVDTKTYLRELIRHYQYLLERTTQLDWVNTHKELITEELFKCQYRLHKLMEVDTEAMITANACASLSRTRIRFD